MRKLTSGFELQDSKGLHDPAHGSLNFREPFVVEVANYSLRSYPGIECKAISMADGKHFKATNDRTDFMLIRTYNFVDFVSVLGGNVCRTLTVR